MDLVILDAATRAETGRLRFGEHYTTGEPYPNPPTPQAWSPDGAKVLVGPYGEESSSTAYAWDYFIVDVAANTWTAIAHGARLRRRAAGSRRCLVDRQQGGAYSHVVRQQMSPAPSETMIRFRVWLSRLRAAFARDRHDEDLDADIRAHLDLLEDEYRARGLSPEGARLAARREFGGLAQLKEAHREQRGLPLVETLAQDVRHGLRRLAQTPGWTFVITATLALGIGMSTAIFSVVYGVLLHPLPYANPARLVALWSTAPLSGYQRFNVNGFDWIRWRAQSHTLEDIAITRPIASFNLTGDGAPERLQGARSSWNLFTLLGVRPLLGRTFTEEEQNADAKVAVLSHGFWKRRFGADPAIVGRKILLNGEPHEVIGVMPEGWQYPTAQFELWTPLFIPPDELQRRVNNDYIAVGRLKSDATLASAQADMSTIMRGIARDYPSLVLAGPSVDVLLQPLLASDTRYVRTALWTLLGAVVGVLAIGCLNLGVLLLVRANARTHELAIRAALGASGARLAWQMLAEALPLAVSGVIGGAGVGWLLLSAFRPFLPAQFPRLESVGLNSPVLLFTTLASVLIVFAASLLPAHAANRAQLTAAPAQGARAATGTTTTRSVLVVAQVAVTVVLLFAGTLFVRSLAGVLRVDPGFRTEGVLTLHLAVTRASRPRDEQISDFYDRIVERISRLPGVAGVGFVNRLPLSGIEQTGPIQFDGSPNDTLVDADWRSTTPGYFAAAGIPLVRGRLFTAADTSHSPAVVLIDAQIAQKVYGDRDPTGARLRIAISGQPWAEVVGVVGHILNATPERDVRPQVYWPESQRTQDRAALVVRTADAPGALTSAVVEQIRQEDPNQPVYDVRSMDEWMSRTLSTRNLLTWLIVAFGCASLLLASLGLYGVMSFAAGLRMREFGIRLALGAPVSHIRGLVLWQAARMVAAGCALGLVLALPVGRALSSLLYGVTGSDRWALAIAPLLFVLVGLVASAGPVRRAARTDPAVTLRAE